MPFYPIKSKHTRSLLKQYHMGIIKDGESKTEINRISAYTNGDAKLPLCINHGQQNLKCHLDSDAYTSTP